MVRTLIKVGVTIVAMGLPTVVHADELSNKFRCDALHLRRQSDLLDCQAHCMQREAARVGTAAPGQEMVSFGRMSDCETRCQDKYDAATEQLNRKPVCGGHPDPDPRRCAAKLLGAQADDLMCASRCADRARRREGFDQTQCEVDCTTAYGTAKDQILALDICRNGPAGIP